MTFITEGKSIKKGTEIELDVESLAFGAKGITRINDLVCFVEGAIPGQKVLARITQKKKKYCEAKIIDVIQQSKMFTEPRCRHFYDCGGCSLQHLDYSQQIKNKETQVQDILQRIGGFNNFIMLPVLPSAELYDYRNKMEFSFARERWLSSEEINSGQQLDRYGLFLGMHAKGFYEKVVDLQECHLVQPVVIDILKTVRTLAKKSGLPVFSTKDHSGFWRFLVVRICKNTEALMVNVITRNYNDNLAEKVKNVLTAKFPKITSLLLSTTTSKASVAFSEKEYLLYGQKTVYEKLGKYNFEISGNSFFQPNTKQAERLYNIVLDFAEFKGNENVYDLYCGAGTISIYISAFVKKVVGFESVSSAIADANNNCKLNNIKNCNFILADLKDELQDTQKMTEQYGEPDVMIIDPPRSGMHPKTVKGILNLQPRRIIHVSCNPATLARDLNLLCNSDYRLIKVQPVDMFPHTSHIEAVALLIRKNEENFLSQK